MTRRFHYRAFILGFDEGGHEAYEELMQAAHVDAPERFKILNQSESWDKEGMHHISVSYIEDVIEDGPEKY